MQTFNMSPNQNYFIIHGLCMNNAGKNWLTGNLASTIQTPFSPKNSPVTITLTWHNESDFSTQEEKLNLAKVMML